MNRSYPVKGLSWQEENLGRKKRMDKGETIRSLRNGKIRQPRIGKGLLTGMEREKLEQKEITKAWQWGMTWSVFSFR